MSRAVRVFVGLVVSVLAAVTAGPVASPPLEAQQKSAAATKSSTARAKAARKPTPKPKSKARASSSRRSARAVPEMPVRAATDDSAAAREAREAFARYTEAFNSARDADAIAFYSDDSRFHWVEDGRVAYTSAAMIRESISSVRKLYPTLRFEPGEVRTTVFGRDAVQLTVPFVQRLVDGGGVEARFEGSMTLSLTKASGSWRVLAGHTSIRRPGGR
jgi:ketosteroid isomerase-like protein